ncbi:MAG: OsmC family protein [Alphaproteobacteria bacterium]|nr:OsmC family protein [Alphaproteobacteria bacterium]
MSTKINGVDTEALADTIDAIKADPGLAKFNFRLKNEWIDGGLNHSTVTDFSGTRTVIEHKTPFVLVNDEPEVLLSGDKGPNPVENLLHALAGCLVSSLVYHAAGQGKKIDAVRTTFEGDIDLRGFLGLSKDVRKGYQGIRVVFDIEGDMTAAEKRAIMAMGPKFSPVFDVVTNGTPVTCVLADDMRMAAE